MAAPDPEKSYPPDGHPHLPPRQHQVNAEGDDYDSDEELEQHDLNLLNTDYAAQRDLSFYPAPYQYTNHYNPSIPPSLRQSAPLPAEIYDYPGRHPPDSKSMLHAGSRYRLPQHNVHAYQSHHQRRPLIDLIRNEWKNSPYTPSSSSPTSQDYLTPNWIQVLSAPRFRRYVLLILGLLGLVWINWHYWAEPQLDEYRLLGESLKERMRTGTGWFGENVRPEFVDMVHVKTLDEGLIPQEDNRKRLIVIGDVHGCHEELVSLLSEVQYEARGDHIILAGDFISKGPASPAVVDLAMSAHASCVRGNHEDRVLLAYRDMYSHRMTHEQKIQKSQARPLPPTPGMPEDMLQDELSEDMVEEESFEHGDSVDRGLAKSFTKTQIDYMAACPVILDLGLLKGMGDVQVVHAGLIPGVRLDKQDPVGVMQMRTIDLDTFVPSSSAKGTAWYKLWNKYQNLIPADQRSTVIYGHNSRKGLQIHDYTKGLDTGCVRGGKLTALIIDNNTQGGEARTVSVKCKDYRDPKKEDVDSKREVE